MTTRKNRTLKHIQYAQVIDVVKANKEVFTPLSNKGFSNTINTMLGFEVSPSTIKEIREYCELPLAPRGICKTKLGQQKTSMRNGLRRLTSEYVRLFRLLGIPEHELEKLTGFAAGRLNYPKQVQNNGSSDEIDQD